MDTVELGRLPNGAVVHLDAIAAAAEAIIVVNRVKAHTAFRGEIESGLCKMTAIGLGKQRGAEQLHDHGLKDGIPLVNIVRNKEQAEILKKIGAKHVVDSTASSFLSN